MTITVEKLKTTLADWSMQEIVSKIGGLAKWALAAGVLIAIPQKVDGIMPLLQEAKIASEDGLIDLDKLYDLARQTVNKAGSVKQNFLGTDISFSIADIESLFAMLKV